MSIHQSSKEVVFGGPEVRERMLKAATSHQRQDLCLNCVEDGVCMKRQALCNAHKTYSSLQEDVKTEKPSLVNPLVVAELVQARSLAMEQVMSARIPECGDFGKIAQGLDWALNEMGIRSDKDSVINKTDPEIPSGALQQTGAFYDIGRKWIQYAQSTGDNNDIAVAVWSAIAECRIHINK
jgi:hypothetical protein